MAGSEDCRQAQTAAGVGRAYEFVAVMKREVRERKIFVFMEFFMSIAVPQKHRKTNRGTPMRSRVDILDSG